MRAELPADLTPLNLKAWLSSKLGVCGCAEHEDVWRLLKTLIVWYGSDIMNRPRYDTLFSGSVGAFYLFDAMLDQAGLVEHGTSARGGWLTQDGKRLLLAFDQHSADDIVSAFGEAYDGMSYDPY